MKQKIAPTSPKNRRDAEKIEDVYRATLQQDFEHPQKRGFGISNVILFLVVSIVAGIVGTVVFLSQNDRFGLFTLSNLADTVLIRGGSRAYTEQEQATGTLIQNIAPSILRLYDQQIPETPGTIQETLLTEEHFVGYGFILTSDGLSFTSSAVLQEGKTYTALNAENTYMSVAVTYRDEQSGLAFFSFPGAGFSVVDITDNQAAFPLEAILVMHKSETQKEYSVSEMVISQHVRDQFLYPDLFIMSSEQYFTDVHLDEHVGFAKGSPIVRGDGTLLGFFNGDANQPSVVYLPERKTVIDEYLTNKKITYTALHVHGIDLSFAKYLPASLRQDKTAGFLLTASSDGVVPAVDDGSAAATSGLQEGDIITEVNGQSITDAQSIGQALLTVHNQNEILVKFFRKGKEQTVSVTNQTEE